MSRLALSLSLLLFFNLPTYAQHDNSSNADAVAVRATVTNYSEGYYTGDASRMEQTLRIT